MLPRWRRLRGGHGRGSWRGMGHLCVGGRGVGFVRVAGGSDTCSEGTGLEVWLFLDGSDIFYD